MPSVEQSKNAQILKQFLPGLIAFGISSFLVMRYG